MKNAILNAKESYTLHYYKIRCKVESLINKGILRHKWINYNDAVNDAIKLLKELYDRNINDKCVIYIYEVNVFHDYNVTDDTYTDYTTENMLSCMQINYIK